MPFIINKYSEVNLVEDWNRNINCFSAF